MAIYEYECVCEKKEKKEVMKPIKEYDKPEFCSCGKKMNIIFSSSINFSFIGDGWTTNNSKED